MGFRSRGSVLLLSLAARGKGTFPIGAGAPRVLEHAMRGRRVAADRVEFFEADAMLVGSPISGTAGATAPMTPRPLRAIGRSRCRRHDQRPKHQHVRPQTHRPLPRGQSRTEENCGKYLFKPPLLRHTSRKPISALG